MSSTFFPYEASFYKYKIGIWKNIFFYILQWCNYIVVKTENIDANFTSPKDFHFV